MRELYAIETEGMTRSAFILRGALAAGAAYGAGAVAPFVSQALAQTSATDLQAIGFALALEQLEAAFYAAALKNSKLSGEVKTLATEFGKHETTHVDTLKQLLEQLGGNAQPAAKAKFTMRNQRDFLKAAVALEDIGVGAYNGVTPAITTPDVVQAFGSIVNVEARHAAAIRFQAGLPPAPVAFDAVLSAGQAQSAVRKLSGG
jgi:rubrerythrin